MLEKITAFSVFSVPDDKFCNKCDHEIWIKIEQLKSLFLIVTKLFCILNGIL